MFEFVIPIHDAISKMTIGLVTFLSETAGLPDFMIKFFLGFGVLFLFFFLIHRIKKEDISMKYYIAILIFTFIFQSIDVSESHAGAMVVLTESIVASWMTTGILFGILEILPDSGDDEEDEDEDDFLFWQFLNTWHMFK